MLELEAEFSPELQLVSAKVELAVYNAAATGPVPQELLHPDGRNLTLKYRISLEKLRDKLLADEAGVPLNSGARQDVTTRAFRLVLLDFAKQQVCLTFCGTFVSPALLPCVHAPYPGTADSAQHVFRSSKRPHKPVPPLPRSFSFASASFACSRLLLHPRLWSCAPLDWLPLLATSCPMHSSGCCLRDTSAAACCRGAVYRNDALRASPGLTTTG